jgi:hypothetical protein
MANNPLREEREHRRILELIPWYVNGTLAADERQLVEAHAASCPRCHGELHAAAEMARAFQEDGEVAPSPHPVHLSRLFARIDAHQAAVTAARHADNVRDLANIADTADADNAGDAADIADIADAADAAEIAAAAKIHRGRSGPRPASSRSSLLARFDFTPRRMRRLLAGELAAILALAAILGWHLRTPAAPSPGTAMAATAATAATAAPVTAPFTEYHTLSSDAPVAVVPGTVPIRVLFSEGATAARIQQILAGIRGQITAGPSPVGAYVVAVPTGPGTDPLDLVLAHLRAQTEVSFAERVAGAGGT